MKHKNNFYIIIAIIILTLGLVVVTNILITKPIDNQSKVNNSFTKPSDINLPQKENTNNTEAKDSLGNYLTPSATEGPYYPYNTKFNDKDNDLTIIGNNAQKAKGNLTEITGTLFGKNGQTLEGYTIELWHADTSGIYNHEKDRKLSQRDQYFQNYGEAITDKSGKFNFKTILTGLYEGRMRHMHYKVVKDGKALLTSQFLIDGDNLTSSDGIYNSMGVAKETMLFQKRYRVEYDETTTILFNPIIRIDL